MRNGLIILVLSVLFLLAPACRPAKKTNTVTPTVSENDAKGTGKTAKEVSQSEEPEILIPVRAEHPTRGTMNSCFSVTSRVEAETRVQVSAEAIGECIKVCAEEGDRVKAGDVLAELDKTELQATIGQTQVQVRQQKNNYDIARQSFQEDFGSKVEQDNALFAYQQAQETLKSQMARLAKLTIRAPVSGIVIKRNVQLGQVVSNGVPVFILVDPESYMVVINPPEKDLPRLRIGQEAKVKIDACPGEEFTARVRRINPAVDQGNVKVVLDFEASTRKRLLDSAFARVNLVMDTHDNALRVNKDALIEENARKYAFILHPKPPQTNDPVTGGTAPVHSPGGKDPSMPTRYEAIRVEVQTGFEDSDYVEVLSGLDDHSLVVSMGQHTLKSGSLVMLTDEQAELNANAGMSPQEALQAAQEKRDTDAARSKAKQAAQAAQSAKDTTVKDKVATEKSLVEESGAKSEKKAEHKAKPKTKKTKSGDVQKRHTDPKPASKQ